MTGKKKDTVVCWQEIGIFFVVAGNFHYDRKKRHITTGKKKIQSSVCWVRGSGNYDRKKKIQSPVCWVRGSGNYDRKKKDTVVYLMGCAVVLFFVVAGNFDNKILLRPKKKAFLSFLSRSLYLY